eukprot:s3503_g1.t1
MQRKTLVIDANMHCGAETEILLTYEAEELDYGGSGMNFAETKRLNKDPAVSRIFFKIAGLSTTNYVQRSRQVNSALCSSAGSAILLCHNRTSQITTLMSSLMPTGASLSGPQSSAADTAPSQHGRVRWHFLSCALRDLRPVAAALEYQAGRTKDA